MGCPLSESANYRQQLFDLLPNLKIVDGKNRNLEEVDVIDSEEEGIEEEQKIEEQEGQPEDQEFLEKEGDEKENQNATPNPEDTEKRPNPGHPGQEVKEAIDKPMKKVNTN